MLGGNAYIFVKIKLYINKTKVVNMKINRPSPNDLDFHIYCRDHCPKYSSKSFSRRSLFIKVINKKSLLNRSYKFGLSCKLMWNLKIIGAGSVDLHIYRSKRL